MSTIPGPPTTVPPTSRPGGDGGGDGGGGGAPSGFDSSQLAEIIAGLSTDSSKHTPKIEGDATVIAGKRAYFQIWGVEPPPGYIENLVRSGLNQFEIISNELAKPGARRTSFYRDQYAALANAAAQLMGFR